MKRPCIAASLVCLAAISGAAEFFGLQTTPAWNDRGDLTVEVTHWSKLALRVESVTATLSGGGGGPCEWKMANAFDLGPVTKHVVIVATSGAVDACARARPLFARKGAHAIRFMPIASADKSEAVRSTRPLLTIEAHVTLRDRPLETSSLWSPARSER